jgi:hypothetical protein
LPESFQPDDEDADSGMRAVRICSACLAITCSRSLLSSCLTRCCSQAHVAAARSKLPMLTQLKQMYACSPSLSFILLISTFFAPVSIFLIAA